MSEKANSENMEQQEASGTPLPFMADTPDTSNVTQDDKASSARAMESILAHQQLLERFCDHIRDTDQQAAHSEVYSKSSRSSYRSKTSRSTNSSRASIISTKVALAAEAAALRAQLKFADMEALKTAELEKKQAELKKLQTMRDLHAAESKLNAIDRVQREENSYSVIKETMEPEYKNMFVEEYLQSLQVPTHGDESPVENSVSITHTEPPATPVVTPDTPVIPVVQTPPKNEKTAINSQENLLGLAKSFADQLNLSRLPPPEPGVFSGDPLKYPSWKGSFETLIEHRGIPASERLHYLKKYLAGPAKEAIEGYFFLTTDDAFNQAKSLLEKRYGDSFVVANAFRDKLDTWPKIASRDGKGLRHFADFLRQCETAMESIGSLNVLNDDRENRKLLAKLPEWLVPRWGRKVSHWKESKKMFPPFAEFVKFIVMEADLACDPVTSLQSLKTEKSQSELHSSRLSRSDQKRTTVASFFTTGAKEKPKNRSQNQPCFLCDVTNHQLDDCLTFLSKPMEERKNFVMKKGLCFACLTQGHRSRQCRNRSKCKTCSRSHPTSLHGDTKEVRTPTKYGQPPQVSNPISHTGVSHLSGTNYGSKSSMIVPVWVSHRDKPEVELLVYALLDTQSDTTFILDRTCHALCLQGPRVNLLLSTMLAKNQRIASQKIQGLMVRGHDSQLKIPLPPAYTREIMPANRSHIPTADMARKWPHLESIADMLMPVANCDVGILIGYNCSRALAPREVIPPVDNEPYGQRTDLGWGIVGIVDHEPRQGDGIDPIGVSHRILTCNVPSSLCDGQTNDRVLLSFQNKLKEVNPSEFSQMMDLDFPERRPDDANMSQDDLQFIVKIKDGIHQRQDGYYEMPLPFRGPEPNLPNNKIMALRRLDQLKNRFKRDHKYHNDYVEFVEGIIQKQHAERVPASASKSSAWYIPHHGVYHPKKPEKIRVVYDCSARFKGESLNSHLLQGPDLINGLVGVLCRFRQEPVAFMCDIEQMFHQFKVNCEHRDYLRFLWWEGGNCDTEPLEYRMGVHLFGAVSSPGCANFGLKRIADDYEDEHGSCAAKFVRQDFYVGDGLKSVSSASEAISLIKQTKELCARGGLRLHKCVSNSREVMETIPSEERAKNIKDLDLVLDALPIERALGVQWCVESDTFQFRIILQDKPLTRRGILSTIGSIYDPLGFVAPVLLVGRRILQDLCRDQVDWDSPLSAEARSRWERWRSDLPLLEKQQIPRCVRPEGFGEVVSTEMHHFSDASFCGYAQCSYLRLTDDQNKVHCAFVMGKSRVTPLKHVTIPRLELTAAVVSVKVSTLLQKEFNTNAAEFFWTDSKVVLGYISNKAHRFHVFVANRIQQIRDRSEPGQWRHVSSENNPADDGSRGISVTALATTSKWLKGPDFLWNNELPTREEPPQQLLCQEDPEVKKVHVLASQSVKCGIKLEQFSDWHCAKRGIAACLTFKSRLKEHSKMKSQDTTQISKSKGNSVPQYRPATVEDLHRAELEIIKLVQGDSFSEEIRTLTSLKVNSSDTNRQLARKRNNTIKKTSALFRLDPFVDEDGILRVGGRIRNAKLSFDFKHPAILPRKHHITELIIRHFHQGTAHQGRSMTTNAIRGHGFWIVGCSSAVAYHISKCVTCRKLYSRVQEQKMANLPEDRLQPAPPFTYCGVDYFGPWLIKEGRKELKRYGVLFTCMASRAIHIEIANSLTTDSFINALRRFIAIRGPIRLLRSDRGTNFVGTETELKKALEEMDRTRVELFLTKRGCNYPEFKMNAPSASHTGGVWERQIRSTRRVLKALMDKSGTQLDEESLRTFMCEAAAIVNSRPLSLDNLNEPTALEPLTPNHLLTMKSSVVLPPPGEFQRVDIYSRKRWRRVQHLANEFWSRWKKDFLHTLQARQKWTRKRPELQVGDIVIVVDDNLPRNEWQLGRVSNVFLGSDDHVRRVKIVIADSSLDARGKRIHPTKYLERPIQKLVLLLEN